MRVARLPAALALGLFLLGSSLHDLLHTHPHAIDGVAIEAGAEPEGPCGRCFASAEKAFHLVAGDPVSVPRALFTEGLSRSTQVHASSRVRHSIRPRAPPFAA